MDAHTKQHRERPTSFTIKELYEKGFEKKRQRDPSNSTLNNEWKQEMDRIKFESTAIKATLEGDYYGKNLSSKQRSMNNMYKISSRNFIEENKLTLGMPAKVNTHILNKKLEKKIREEQTKPESIQKQHQEYFKYSKSLYESRPRSAQSHSSSQRVATVKYTRPTTRHSQIKHTVDKTLWELDFDENVPPLQSRPQSAMETPKQYDVLMGSYNYLQSRKASSYGYALSSRPNSPLPRPASAEGNTNRAGFVVNSGMTLGYTEIPAQQFRRKNSAPTIIAASDVVCVTSHK